MNEITHENAQQAALNPVHDDMMLIMFLQEITEEVHLQPVRYMSLLRQPRCSGQLSRPRVFSNKDTWQKINQSPRISSHRLQIEAAAAGPRLAFTCPACKGTLGDKLIFSVTPTQTRQSVESTLNIKEPFLVDYSKLPSNTDCVEIEHGEFSDQMSLHVPQMILDYGAANNNPFHLQNN